MTVWGRESEGRFVLLRRARGRSADLYNAAGKMNRCHAIDLIHNVFVCILEPHDSRLVFENSVLWVMIRNHGFTE